MRAQNQTKPRNEPQVYLGRIMFQKEGATDTNPQQEDSVVEG